MMNFIGVEVTESEITRETFVEIKTMIIDDMVIVQSLDKEISRIENLFQYLKRIHLQM